MTAQAELLSVHDGVDALLTAVPAYSLTNQSMDIKEQNNCSV
jgi:hypothetical protein